MRVKKVNRYYCDFCKKAGSSAYHLRRHESVCTMNPNRVCGVCKMLEDEQPSLIRMIASLPLHEDHLVAKGKQYEHYAETLTSAANDSLPALRDIANNCPACILAAIRQAHIPVPMVTDFNFTEEMKDAWTAFNEGQREHGE